MEEFRIHWPRVVLFSLFVGIPTLGLGIFWMLWKMKYEAGKLSSTPVLRAEDWDEVMFFSP
jgi:hypothetical protein